MPIITQAYPCMNSSYNVSSSTLRIMTEEFQRGMKFVRLWTQTRLVGIIYLSHILSSNHIRIICRLISVQQMMTTLGSGNMLIYMNFGFLFFLLGRIQQLSVITCNIISTCFIDMMIDYSTENAPLQRELSAEEVGSTAAFLASPLASAITGDVVYVDNGLNAMGVGVDSPVFKDLDHQSFSYQFCESKNFDYIKNKCMPSHLFISFENSSVDMMFSLDIVCF